MVSRATTNQHETDLDQVDQIDCNLLNDIHGIDANHLAIGEAVSQLLRAVLADLLSRHLHHESRSTGVVGACHAFMFFFLCALGCVVHWLFEFAICCQHRFDRARNQRPMTAKSAGRSVRPSQQATHGIRKRIRQLAIIHTTGRLRSLHTTGVHPRRRKATVSRKIRTTRGTMRGTPESSNTRRYRLSTRKRLGRGVRACGIDEPQ